MGIIDEGIVDRGPEEWRPVVGYEGLYEVSSLGRVKRVAAARGARVGRILRASPTTSEHRGSVVLWNTAGGKSKKTHHVHVLVCTAFNGPRPVVGNTRMECRHLNGNAHDNRACNLAWGTAAENQADRALHGTANIGERHGMAKLTDFKARCVKALLALGASCSSVARTFGVSTQTIADIKWRGAWKHVVVAVSVALLPMGASADAGFCVAPYCGTGRPDPWPASGTLPNDQMLAAYLARYECPVGVQPCRRGFSAELQGANIIALQNACRAGLFGPGHDCNPTITEEVDSSFVNPRGGSFMERWWWQTLEGGSAENPHVTHDTTRPCGPYTLPGTSGYTQYFNNTPPCGMPAPRCGDGHADPGETCANCVADLGPCPPPPPPPDLALHLGVGGRFLVGAVWTTPATPTVPSRTGPAKPLPVKRDGGAFVFFDPERPELYVNVIDGCGVNARWWVFSAGLTNVGVDLTVTDTRTGAVWRHASPVGQTYATVLDTGAMACP